jgi:two-component system, NarL family, invasion response regulator UvrY
MSEFVTPSLPQGSPSRGMIRDLAIVIGLTLLSIVATSYLRRMLERRAETRVLIFSMYEDAIFAHRALEAGAGGYVTKASAPNVLVDAVLTVARGKRYLGAEIALALALRDSVTRSASADALSAREFEVLRLLVKGEAIKDIATRLGLTPKTVANHQSAIKQKLGADSAVQLLRIASRLGLDP